MSHLLIFLLLFFVLIGKTPEEIRKTFNIKNDFTPEEEEQVGLIVVGGRVVMGERGQGDHVTLYDEIIVLLFQIRKENEWCEEK